MRQIALALLIFWLKQLCPLLARKSRYSALHKPLSKTAKAYHALQLLVAIFLLMVSLGILIEPTPGYFAAGLSVFMLTSWISVLLSLEILLHGNPKVERRK